MPNQQIGEHHKIGTVGVKVFRLDLPEDALPKGVSKMYAIAMIDDFKHESSVAVGAEPNDAMIERAVDVHVRISQAITRRN